MDERVVKVWDASKLVIEDCVLKNGALVAANSIGGYYPAEAKYYHYIWPRDGAFTCMAADIAGIHTIQEPFFDWIRERAEDLWESGLLYEKYFANGLQAEHRFQPDQGSSILLAIRDHFKSDMSQVEKYRDLVQQLARGYCDHWDGDQFKLVTNDLWEERHTFPDLKENFSYALAACAHGLWAANEMFPNERYERVAGEMRDILMNHFADKKYFYRSFGLLNDDRIDASMLGLIWPFPMVAPNDEIARNTVKEIEDKLVKFGGVYRYEHDEYDGWIKKGWYRKKGGGHWPLLTFWLAIVLDKMGRREDALKYYNNVLDIANPENGFLPEQVFQNNIQKAIAPLCWSHNMFILATKELGLLDK